LIIVSRTNNQRSRPLAPEAPRHPINPKDTAVLVP